MTKVPKDRLLSDGKKPPSIPDWVWLIVFVAMFPLMSFALSKLTYVAGFFVVLWRNRAGE